MAPSAAAMSPMNNFPSGLRVLVVDDDAPTLKVVSRMLQACAYQVTSATSGKEALSLLRDKKKAHYDLVLSDVMMPDMDGFRLLELIGLELDLPVIMMSSNGETNTVLRGVTHGAVDYLIKPVRIEELRNMWQHVVRRRKDLVKEESEDHDHNSGEREEVHCEITGKKRKEHIAHTASEAQDEDASASKKARVVWSVEMHQQFVQAVNQLGVDKAVPKKILEIMQVEGLTRENVASHLQKYRLYLKRVSSVPNGLGSLGQAGAGPSSATALGLQSVPSLPLSGPPSATLPGLAAPLPAMPGPAMPGPNGALPGLGPMPGASGAAANGAARGGKAVSVGGKPASPATAATGGAGVGPGPPTPAPAGPMAPDAAEAGAADPNLPTNPLAAANMAAAAAGYPNPLMGSMAAAMMNGSGGLNPHLLGAMNPLNMGMMPGMGQNMGMPNMHLPGLPMVMPFMQQGMGMQGVMPGMMPQGLNMAGPSPPPGGLPGSGFGNIPRQGSDNLAQFQQQQQQQQQLQQQHLLMQQHLAHRHMAQQQQQQQQQGSASNSNASGCSSSSLALPSGQFAPPFPMLHPPTLTPPSPSGQGMQGLGLPGLVHPGLPALQQHQGMQQQQQQQRQQQAVDMSSSSGPALPNGALEDPLFMDHSELAAAFNELYNGQGDAGPLSNGPGQGAASQGLGSVPGALSSNTLLAPKLEPEFLQLEGRGPGGLGVPDPGQEGMDDFINFFLKG